MTLQKTDSFLPLTPVSAAASGREFRVTVVPQSAAPAAFKDLAQTAPQSAGSAPAAGGARSCEPRVSLERDGDRIANIRIQCSCGQVMELACVYDESLKPK